MDTVKMTQRRPNVCAYETKHFAKSKHTTEDSHEKWPNVLKYFNRQNGTRILNMVYVGGSRGKWEIWGFLPRRGDYTIFPLNWGLLGLTSKITSTVASRNQYNSFIT